MSLNKSTTPNATLTEILLASIWEITASVESTEVEKDKFIETGCYLYRVSVAITELQTTETAAKDLADILESLSEGINLAKDLVQRCKRSNNQISDSEGGIITAELEGVVKHVGRCLQMIPSITFADQEYAELAVRSLSTEMENVHFGVSQADVLCTKKLDPPKLLVGQIPKREKMPTELDLYPISVEFSKESSQLLTMPCVSEFLTGTKHRSQKRQGSTARSSSSLTQYIEPLYETFFCPLTKEIMEDPVTIESGVTYEREVITEWFARFQQSDEILCPTTGKKLTSRVLNPNIALKTTIEEWRERNEAERIKVARTALSLASSENMVMEAIKDLQQICQKTPYNKVQVCNIGMLPLLIKCLDYEDINITCAALELLQQLAEESDVGKETIVKEMDSPTIIKLLSSSHQSVRHAILLLLLELSKSQPLCERIRLITGGILMLITIKYNQSTDALGSEKADQILRNLEKTPENIKCMAENGLLEPLLNHLTEGPEEMQMEMASYLGEIVLENDQKTYVADTASPALIKMVQSGNTLSRSAAFKTLVQISSYHSSGKILAEAGIVKIMAEEMFTRRIYNEPMDSQNEAAAILANILESGTEHENLRVNTHGHTVTSDYFVCNIIHMLKNSTSDGLLNLVRILLCLTRSHKSIGTIVSVVKETDASYTLIELINHPHEELGVAALKLLTALSPCMGHTLAEKLCKVRDQPDSLIQFPAEVNHITEKQAVSTKFLAELPHQNLTLNLALLSKNRVTRILEMIHLIQKSGRRTSRYATAYLEGLVGVLVRFTATLYEPQILFLAINHNFTSEFTELLMTTSTDEVQRLSANGLEHLSSKSINLSKPAEIKRTKSMKLFYVPKSLSFGSSRKRSIPVCPIHRGICSSQNTFCLVDANAVETLLACLDHENPEVVEAALSAICTLLDDKVDVDKSLSMLSEAKAIQHVLNVVKEHRKESLWQKSFWVIERFLVKGGDKSVSDISQDRLLPAMLVSAFRHCDSNTRQMAEKILVHLNKMPIV